MRIILSASGCNICYHPSAHLHFPVLLLLEVRAGPVGAPLAAGPAAPAAQSEGGHGGRQLFRLRRTPLIQATQNFRGCPRSPGAVQSSIRPSVGPWGPSSGLTIPEGPSTAGAPVGWLPAAAARPQASTGSDDPPQAGPPCP